MRRRYRRHRAEPPAERLRPAPRGRRGPAEGRRAPYLWEPVLEPDPHTLAGEGEVGALLRLLFDQPELVDLRNCLERWTPLHQAAYHCRAGAAEALLTFGAHVDARDRWGQTPLMRAAAPEPLVPEPPEPVIRVLLSHGADPNAADAAGNRPLHYAAYSHPESVRLLLAAGAAAGARNKEGVTPLHNAALSGETTALRVLLAESPGDIDLPDRNGQTPLHHAAYWRQAGTVEILLSCGVRVDPRDRWGDTPLMQAVVRDELLAPDPPEPVVRLLLSRGADPNAVDEEGDTALHTAALFDEAGCARILIEAGADAGARNMNGDTPLHHAAQWDALKAASVLLSFLRDEADVPNAAGVRPSSVAATKGWRELAEMIGNHSPRTP